MLAVWIALVVCVVLLVNEWVDVFTGSTVLEHVREWRRRRAAVVDVQGPIQRAWERERSADRRRDAA